MKRIIKLYKMFFRCRKGKHEYHTIYTFEEIERIGQVVLKCKICGDIDIVIKHPQHENCRYQTTLPLYCKGDRCPEYENGQCVILKKKRKRKSGRK